MRFRKTKLLFLNIFIAIVSGCSLSNPSSLGSEPNAPSDPSEPSGTNCEDEFIDASLFPQFRFEAIDDDKCEVFASETFNLTEVVIPEYIKMNGHNYIVTAIGQGAFYKRSSITYVEIGNTVKSIGLSAFELCSSLFSVVIGNNLTSIGSIAFASCSSLTSINIPHSVTSIGIDVFASCSSLQFNMYDNCNYLGNNSNPFHALITYSTQCQTYEINPNCKIIAGNAFYKCSSLISLIVPDRTISLCDFAFYNCSSLSSVSLGNNVTSIGDSAFSGCSSLSSITMGDNVTSIGNYAFSNCSSLNLITIPGGVTSIGGNAFYNCLSLNSIFISENLTYIGYGAFSRCSSLMNVCYSGSIEDWCNIFFADTLSSPMCFAKHFYMLNESNELYEVREIIIPNKVTEIGNNQFVGFKNITSIFIPDSVTFIGENAFYDCSSITSITIPFIGDGTINNTHFGYIFGATSYSYNKNYVPNSLNEVIISDACTSIGDYAFYNSSSLVSIKLGKSVTSIGENAFSLCLSITSIIIPDSVTSIGKHAFSNCSSLVSIVIPKSVTYIGYEVFRGCNYLTIYCEMNFIPLGWNSKWNSSKRPVYMDSEWEYVNGVPTPIN